MSAGGVAAGGTSLACTPPSRHALTPLPAPAHPRRPLRADTWPRTGYTLASPNRSRAPRPVVEGGGTWWEALRPGVAMHQATARYPRAPPKSPTHIPVQLTTASNPASSSTAATRRATVAAPAAASCAASQPMYRRPSLWRGRWAARRGISYLGERDSAASTAAAPPTHPILRDDSGVEPRRARVCPPHHTAPARASLKCLRAGWAV